MYNIMLSYRILRKVCRKIHGVVQVAAAAVGLYNGTPCTVGQLAPLCHAKTPVVLKGLCVAVPCFAKVVAAPFMATVACVGAGGFLLDDLFSWLEDEGWMNPI
jgi:hypothetical protein